MNDLLIGLVSTLLATNPPAAVSNLVFNKTGAEVQFVDANDKVEQEFQAVLAEDDKAQAEVDKWIRDNQAFAKEGAGISNQELNRRILARFDIVKKAYQDFIAKHPNHARARLAFASFLDDIGDEEGSHQQMVKSLELDPKNPAVWNNLANYYGHYGEVKKAFEYYAKAIDLNPEEPVYYQNFGTTVFLFRKDAKEYYHINEQQVFDKALVLYSNAMKLAPDDFPLASDVAQTYYGIKPWRTNDAMVAWTNALKVAHNEIEREGVYIHMARLETAFGRFEAAAAHLGAVTNAHYTELKRRVARSLEEHREQAGLTNAPTTSTDIE